MLWQIVRLCLTDFCQLAAPNFSLAEKGGYLRVCTSACICRASSFILIFSDLTLNRCRQNTLLTSTKISYMYKLDQEYADEIQRQGVLSTLEPRCMYLHATKNRWRVTGRRWAHGSYVQD
jgi:hypothetical protein